MLRSEDQNHPCTSQHPEISGASGVTTGAPSADDADRPDCDWMIMAMTEVSAKPATPAKPTTSQACGGTGEILPSAHKPDNTVPCIAPAMHLPVMQYVLLDRVTHYLGRAIYSYYYAVHLTICPLRNPSLTSA